MYKAVIATFLSGVVLGGYLVHQFEYAKLVNYVARGFCGQYDVARTFYLFNCQDGYIAAQMQQGQESVDDDTKAILTELSSKPKRKRK